MGTTRSSRVGCIPFPNCPSKKKPRGESEPLCDEKMPRASRVHVSRANFHEGIQHVILGAWSAPAAPTDPSPIARLERAQLKTSW